MRSGLGCEPAVVPIDPSSDDLAGRGRGAQRIPARPLHPLRPGVVRPPLAVLAGHSLDAREAVFLHDPSPTDTHVQQMLDAATGEAMALRRRLRPVLAIILLQDACGTEYPIRERHHQSPQLGWHLAVHEREPPDLRVRGIARDPERQLYGRYRHPRRREDARVTGHLDADWA